MTVESGTGQSGSGQRGAGQPDAFAGFGANEWLVYEMYQQYLKDPESVDKAWWDFFADYQPTDAQAGPSTTAPSTNGATAATSPAPATTRSSSDSAPARSATPAPSKDKDAEKGSTKPAEESAPAAAGGSAGRGSGVGVNGASERSERESAPQPQSDLPSRTPLRGAAARVVTNMEASLAVPTATSVRAIPAKLLIDNRVVINNHLRRGRGGKVSFTHLIGFALVRALADFPVMNRAFSPVDGKPGVSSPDHVNLGLAIDLAKDDGSRSLVVPNIKNADTLDFSRFWAAYEDLIRKARTGKLTADDFAGTTISLTNPGTIGTVHSVPRLMAGQGAIVGVGAMEYPAEYQGAAEDTLARLAISKVMTLTSTYDHRIIQGAESGDFLRRMHALLLGDDGFYDEIFRSLRIPYEPVRWITDIAISHDEEVGKPARVIELIHAYRVRGHLMADTNPLEFELRRHPDLDVVQHGLTLWDLDREFPTGGFGGKQLMKLREVLGVLRDSYCRTVGIEYMHIQDPEQRRWIQDRVERHHESPPREEQLRILGKLNQAEAFETFLQTKYVGQKRFSLEGGESVIPLLDAVVSEAAHDDMDEVVIGMAHRGRLNVLTNIVGKSYTQVFREFEGNLDPRTAHGSGDVKYHLGAEGEYTAIDGERIAVSLTSNPSHLEAVDPVLEGIARAKQDVINRGATGFTVLPVLIHGDAAFAGQGVVAETLNLSQLRGYRTGGSVHVVINNQVGFTTSPTSARSSVYSTDVARMIQAPIFHVNGDDPEAVVRVARLAYEFRQTFKKDVVIDMLCYRRRGHSEVDEPSFTQPVMYDLIDAKRSVRKIYTESLIGRGDITVEEAEAALRDYQEQLERVFAETRDVSTAPPEAEREPRPEPQAVDTAITTEVLKRIGESQINLPEGFTVHPRLLPQLQKRAQMVSDGGIDWAMGETLAFGSLLLDGTPIRLAGQDSRRGTFGQRHAVLVDRRTAEEHTPLAHLSDEQAPFYVYDSLLSEYAAMGFEYGYSVARPEALVLWEAQFGDFANGAQSIVDEFISAGEAKWGQRSSVVLLLPHGYEGQGPDHSSARIERYLALSAEDNWKVAMPSTPANYFHLLRLQAMSGRCKPLVVFTPKSMLRLRAATSKPDDFTSGGWQPVIPDSHVDAEAVTRVILCTGKVCYDLAKQRDARDIDDVAIVRLEQLFPLPADELTDVLSTYPSAKDIVWLQEEPANQGAWPFVALNVPEHLESGRTLRRVSRPASASPAAGSHMMHEAEQASLFDTVFG
ncbi:MAG TPA: multifunctional oxoglutarate decarboxylase/oxoglutarate dehydrogenase thiamine pyrophosphate-binding subunit/dihydrolipoyllysine-residue succinyltransferase subunit [Mycobacteriales bacterium]|nr:multifunctional oxoglutarate decarboxylase/oxoglutarate dehydrogenase thiamine pyrophosphate-binding subunit/dihydrolipoyllysine-residue succinyltransferase subunit [Mycobacteriales bacterium]